MYYYCGMVVEKGREGGKCYTTALNIITPRVPSYLIFCNRIFLNELGAY